MKKYKYLNPSKCWFTSDWHLDHKNVIRFDDRPFADITEMNQEIVRRHNSVVKPDDYVFMLGDVSLGNAASLKTLLPQFNGKLVLIQGNHEGAVMGNAGNRAFFESIHEYLEIKVGEKGQDQFIVLFHYPIRVWNKSHYGSWQLYGHVHIEEGYNSPYKDVNVGIMHNDYYPFSYYQLEEIMKTKKDKGHHDN